MTQAGLAGLGVFAALLLLSGGKRPAALTNPLGLQLSEGQIARLHPSIQPLARELIRRAYEGGIPVAVGSGLRSYAEQDALHAQGRTDVAGGSSWHNFGLAFDLAVLSGSRLTYPNDDALWTRLGVLAEGLGLQWGGRWSKPDWDHFEYHPGMTLADARAGRRPVALA